MESALQIGNEFGVEIEHDSAAAATATAAQPPSAAGVNTAIGSVPVTPPLIRPV